MVVVDTWLVWNKCTEYKENVHEFFCRLADELIDNNYDSVTDTKTPKVYRSSKRLSSTPSTGDSKATADSATIATAIGPRLSPTKRRRKHKGKVVNQLYQGHCCVKDCKGRSTQVCSLCRDDLQVPENKTYVCKPTVGNPKECFDDHMKTVHGYGKGDEDNTL